MHIQTDVCSILRISSATVIFHSVVESNSWTHDQFNERKREREMNVFINNLADCPLFSCHQVTT